ncbi:hypothetical protein Pfra02_23490 [Pseudomonas fragi]|nr:hypothetical protein Pfra02_23490 [Pseudomonas fragi]
MNKLWITLLTSCWAIAAIATVEPAHSLEKQRAHPTLVERFSQAGKGPMATWQNRQEVGNKTQAL